MQSITVIGRRWFDKVNGNTYHTAEILIDGKPVHKVPFTYGYGDHYVQSAQEWLTKEGLIAPQRYPNSGGVEMLWTYCERQGIKFYHTYTDTKRKKDL